MAKDPTAAAVKQTLKAHVEIIKNLADDRATAKLVGKINFAFGLMLLITGLIVGTPRNDPRPLEVFTIWGALLFFSGVAILRQRFWFFSLLVYLSTNKRT